MTSSMRGGSRRWRSTNLGELIRVKHGYAFKGEYFCKEGHYIVLTPGNFFEEGGFRLREGKEKFYSGPIPPDYVLHKGSLIVAMTEQGEGLLGSAAIVPQSDKFLHNQRLGLVSAIDPDNVDLPFVYYLFNSKDVRQQIRNTSSGAKVRHTSPSRIGETKAQVPPIAEQRRIASILSTYDNLIENNTRRIAILEEIAGRIYEEWFVHFRFPGHEQVGMVKSELGLMPEGWAAKSLGEFIEFKKGKKPPAVSSEPANGLLPHLLIDALRGANRSEFVSPDKLIPTVAEDTIMVMDGSGSCDVFIGHTGVIGSTLGRYRIAEGFSISPFWLFLFFSTHLDEIKAKNIGAAIPHANKDFIHGMSVPIATPEVTEQFDQAIRPMFRLIGSLRRKNANLRATRDLLLPKLISGELDVSDLPEPEAMAA